MKVIRSSWGSDTGWDRPPLHCAGTGLVLHWGSRAALAGADLRAALRARFPLADIVGCSTGGQLLDGDVSDEMTSVLALSFAQARHRVVSATVGADLGRAARRLGAELVADDLRAVFVLADGLHLNGSELVQGLQQVLGLHVLLVGGLAGDGAAFEMTLTAHNDEIGERRIVAIGLYGAGLRATSGSGGGWDKFGPKRTITRSAGNVLYELDGEPALDLYERYLGEEAAGLPSTGLLYPLSINDPSGAGGAVVRTILKIDRDQRSLTYAGDVPQGWNGQLMRGYFDRLAEGAVAATSQALAGHDDPLGDIAAIFVSCIGRRLLMGQNIMDEITAAGSVLPGAAVSAGFYSYGEIAPQQAGGKSDLHNQTMTVTMLSERAA